ncbi:MAG: response regulator, partial [Cyanobacteria bacterium P01_F01_bin.53]
IIGMSSLLKGTELDEEQIDFVETIRMSGDSLLTIINDILDFSKIEAGRMELEEHTFDLYQTIESAVDLLAQKASEKGIELICLIETDVPRIIKSDSTRIRQVLVNLLSNAVKFTKEGEVFVTVKNMGVHESAVDLFIEVKDSGIGIPQDKIRRLFKPFSQVDQSTTRKYGGTGLGLVICRRLCNLMGGEIGVTSVDGEGSTFYFNIVAQVADEAGAPLATQNIPLIVTGKRALVVDDNETNRKVLAYFLKNWGIAFESVDSGDAAAELLKHNSEFDFALVDYHMPGELDGLDLSHLMHRDYPHIPVIMLSSSFNMSDLLRPANIVSWQYKPIKPDRVYKEIARAVMAPSKVASSEPLDDVSLHPDQFDPQRELTILLAEDNVVNQKVFTRQLQKLEYECDVVSDGQEAVESVERQPYDIIFMDVQMPTMDGIEATVAIRSLGGSVRQPLIVALTADRSAQVVETCMEAGMNGAIEKPAHRDEIIRMLNLAFQTNSEPL